MKRLFFLILLSSIVLATITVDDYVFFELTDLNSTIYFNTGGDNSFTRIIEDGDSNISRSHWTFDDEFDISLYCSLPEKEYINTSILNYNTTFFNFSVESTQTCQNMSLILDGLLVNRSFAVSVNGSEVGKKNAGDDGYYHINFTGNGATQFYFDVTRSYICSSNEWGRWNGSVYNYMENQTFAFYCFPKHDNCVPRYETSSRPLINVSRAYSDEFVKFSLNDTDSHYNFKVHSSFNGTLANDYNLSTTGIYAPDTIGGDGYAEYFLFIDSYYPFDDFSPQLICEVCI